MAWRCPWVFHYVFVPYILRKFRRSLSFFYWWIWNIFVLTSYHILSVKYFRVLSFYFRLFYLCLYNGLDSFFVWYDLKYISNRLYQYHKIICFFGLFEWIQHSYDFMFTEWISGKKYMLVNFIIIDIHFVFVDGIYLVTHFGKLFRK